MVWIYMAAWCSPTFQTCERSPGLALQLGCISLTTGALTVSNDIQHGSFAMTSVPFLKCFCLAAPNEKPFFAPPFDCWPGRTGSSRTSAACADVFFTISAYYWIRPIIKEQIWQIFMKSLAELLCASQPRPQSFIALASLAGAASRDDPFCFRTSASVEANL